MLKMFSHWQARKLLWHFDVFMPLVLWCLVALFYSSLTFGCRLTPVVAQQNQFCYLGNVTFDNVLPQLFADNVYNGHPKTLMGNWHSSDRPPLQAGAVLLEYPFTESASMNILDYQILACFLQVFWIPIVWLLARRLGVKSGGLAIVLLLCLSSGFFFNSVFTWPKLLAGSLAVVGFSLLVFEKPTLSRWFLAAAAIGAAMLSHEGVVFGVLPLAIPLCTMRHFPGWKVAASSATVVLALLERVNNLMLRP